MTAFKYLNLAVRFILELCALAALGYWGFNTSDNIAVGFALGLGAPLVAGVVWGLYVAPKARNRLPDPFRLLLEIMVFAAAAAALVAANRAELAAVFAIAAAISIALMFLWGQRTIA